ncbi:YraN family protein [Cognatishimia activa]|uniref:YraN family protein n=1 Tax=Cognatishimia activa TaxID=1715691 RepID=UPI002231F8AF|nr:YraN family protein [Cognatishimia activa]UZD90121.1 YraN family protein [Cognatishimia activa]
MQLNARQLRGQQNYLSGVSGENAVQRIYEDRGCRPLTQRWRGGGGELDLVFEDDQGLVFVEVKTARRHDLAAQRISPAQVARIMNAASIFAERYSGGVLVDMRFDVALVNGKGEVHILENALLAT